MNVLRQVDNFLLVLVKSCEYLESVFEEFDNAVPVLAPSVRNHNKVFLCVFFDAFVVKNAGFVTIPFSNVNEFFSKR